MFDTPLITTRLNALLAALVLAAAAALVAGGGGYALGHRLAKADGDAALAKLQRAHAEATAKAADEARLRLVAEVERNNRLAQALADEKATHAQEKQSLLRRIANVTTVYVPAAGLAPRPLPRTVFTAGFMREYNAAIGLPTAETGTTAAGTGGTAEAALARLQHAQARGDALEERLAVEEASRQSQALEHAREIKRLTTGRPCLNAGTVRLLNESTIGLRASTLPTPASGAIAADAAAASDTDVAGWIDAARRQYDACRDRLGALIDWHQEATDGHR